MGLLEGKVVLITGGTSGIGRASAKLFSREGANVALTGRRAAEGEEVVAEILAAGGEAIFIQTDLGTVASIPEIVSQVVSKFGGLNCAFNNAGVSGGGPIETLEEPVWDRIIDTNLKAVFFCLKAEVEQMKRQGGGGAILFQRLRSREYRRGRDLHLQREQRRDRFHGASRRRGTWPCRYSGEFAQPVDHANADDFWSYRDEGRWFAGPSPGCRHSSWTARRSGRNGSSRSIPPVGSRIVRQRPGSRSGRWPKRILKAQERKLLRCLIEHIRQIPQH